MKMIKVYAQNIIQNNNSLEISTDEINGNIKIIDAELKAKVTNVSTQNSNYRVDYYADIQGVNAHWQNVDMLKNIIDGQDITINISDELQTALDCKASKLTLEFVGNDSSITFDNDRCLEISYISLSQYQENSTNHTLDLRRAGTASINLATGELSLSAPLVSSDNNVLPLSINANYNTFSSNIVTDTGLPENWSLNIQQFLIKNADNESLTFTYVGADGKEHIIEEKYYYLDGEEKKYINRSELSVDLDGKLKYHDKSVETSLEAPSGIKLVSSIDKIPGYILVDFEPEELIKVKSTIKMYDDNINDYKQGILNIQREIYITTVASLSGQAFTYNDIVSKITSYFTYSYDDKSDITIDKDLITNDYFTFDEYVKISSEVGIVSNSEDKKVVEEKLNAYKSKATIIESCNKLKTLKDKLTKLETERNKFVHQRDLLDMQIPVHFLYDENFIVYGFGKTSDENIYRLILITDSYQNDIFISYNSLDDNMIDGISNSSGKAIMFTYKDKTLTSIIDTRDRKTNLDFSNTKIIKITTNNTKTSYYYFNDDRKLEAIFDCSGLGALINYENNKVSSINQLSAIESVKHDREDNLKSNFDFETITNFNDHVIANEYVNFQYNNLQSTTLVNGKDKNITYIFDKYGKIRTIHENKFSKIAEERCINVKEFSYQNNKISSKIINLPYSTDYLQQTYFGAEAREDAIFLSDTTFCGDDLTPYQYITSSLDYYTMPSTNNENQYINSVSLNDKMIALINNKDENNLCSHRAYVVSGWAKADSAFILTDENPSNYADYIKTRKFEIHVKITYENELDTTEFTRSFDWRNTDWQYCAVPIVIEENKVVKNIDCYIDYSGNTGNISYTNLEFKEGDYETIDYLDNLPIKKVSAHSQWITNYEYNTDNKLIKEIITNKLNLNEKFITTYEYNKSGQLLRSIDYNGIVKENVFNDKGVIVKSITYHKDEPSKKFYLEQTLDDHGNVLSEVNSLGEETTKYEYINGTGIVSSTLDENGAKTSYGYAQDDALLSTTSTINGINNTNSFGYTLDFLTSLNHNDFSIKYEYNHAGKLSKINIADSDKDYLNKIYNDNEEITKLATDEAYKQTFRDDGKLLDTYYKKNYSTGEFTADNLISRNIYDTYGNLVFIKDLIEDNIHKIRYDKFNNVYYEENTQHGADVSVRNLFDSNHANIRESIVSINNKDYTYQYNYTSTPDAKLTAVTLPTNTTQSISYDKLGRTDKISLGNLTKQLTYLQCGDHTSNLISTLQFALDGVNQENLRYTYDKKGNITQVRVNNTLIARYTYDSLSRLIREDNRAFNKTTTLTYDAGGNITLRTEYPFTLVENLDYETGSPYTYSYSISGWRDQLREYNGVRFTYDRLGNPTTYRNNTLSWSHARQLDRYGDIAEYTYNSSGIRTSKHTHDFTTKFYLNGNQILRQTDASNTLTFYYGVDGVTGFHLKNNLVDSDFYYKKNAQNDIIGIYDSENVLICKYIYDAWGKQKCLYLSNNENYVDIEENYAYNDTSNLNRFIAYKNPFRYRSYYYDFETGLYYLNSRYYDPELCRFINADDISYLDKDSLNGLNLYVYCSNNPIMSIDPEGTWDWRKFWKGLGLTIAAVVLVTVITTAAVLTAGVAAAVLGASVTTISTIMTSTAIGGLIAGGISILGQGIDNGFDKLNLGSIAINTFTGAAFGAITGAIGPTASMSTKILGALGKIGLSGLSATLHGINNGDSPENIANSAKMSMAFTSILQIFGVGFSLRSLSGSGEVSKNLFIRIMIGINNTPQLKTGLVQFGAIILNNIFMR